jgi:N-acetylmuramoyl-L-alanine amidase
MRKITKIILHSSATPEGREVTVEDIDRWHKERGWSGIGYHYVIDLKGNVHEGRPIERSGAHCKGHNKHSIGVCYIGGVNQAMKAKDTRTAFQKPAMHNFLMELMAAHEGATLHGHNEFSNKACPSFDVQEVYKDIIDFYANV